MPTARLFADYHRYHKDPRNKILHFVGIPLIVYGLLRMLWFETGLHVGATPLLGADFVLVSGIAWYSFLRVRLGLMAGILYVPLYLLASVTPSVWIGMAVFALGWAVQFLGHAVEGRRPAFTQNVVQLFTGPVWIAAQVLAWAGLFPRETLVPVERGPLI